MPNPAEQNPRATIYAQFEGKHAVHIVVPDENRLECPAQRAGREYRILTPEETREITHMQICARCTQLRASRARSLRGETWQDEPMTEIQIQRLLNRGYSRASFANWNRGQAAAEIDGISASADTRRRNHHESY